MSKLLNDVESKTGLLPPMIILNPRMKLEADKVSISDIQPPKKEEEEAAVDSGHQLLYCEPIVPPVPIPISPINITWAPNTLCFNLETEPVLSKLWVWNLSTRPIYIHCCGLWDETARYGASWCCFPRTRFWLPSGLKAELWINAAPREHSPVPRANAFLQIAAKHMRDTVTGYFSVPIVANFLNYIVPPEGEIE